MRKLSVISCQLSALMLIFAFSIGVAQAAAVGSPASLLKKGQWDFSLGGGYIYERPMERSGSSDYHVDIIYGYHSRSYGLTDRLSVTGKVGGTYGYLYDETIVGAGSKTSLSGGFVLGGQLKGIVFQDRSSGFEVDASGQFLYMRSHHKSSGKANADWYEWQLSTCLVKQIGDWFKPYAGLRFSTVDLDHEDGQGNKTSYDEDGNFGPVVGCDIYFGEDRDIVVNLEAGFLMGTEFFATGRYRF